MSEILIVDDNRELLSVMVSLLELYGHHVSSAGSYEGGLVLLQAKAPELAVLDYHLSVKGEGLGMLGIIRSTPALARAKVIMISGLDLSEECFKKGADGFLQKPFELNELLAEMERLGIKTEV